MEAHQTAVSDPVSFPVKKGMTLTVSLYFADFTLMQSAVLVTGPLSKGFFSLGDQTHADALPMDTTKTTNWFYFLSNIELMTAEENHTVICYGDSITAGAWPDYLTLLARQNPDNHTAFIRRATSGSRVLRQYECITYDSYGLKGTNRFPHEDVYKRQIFPSFPIHVPILLIFIGSFPIRFKSPTYSMHTSLK